MLAFGFFSFFVLEGVLAAIDVLPTLGGGTGVSLLLAPRDICGLGIRVTAGWLGLSLFAAASDTALAEAACFRFSVAADRDWAAEDAGASAISSSELLSDSSELGAGRFCATGATAAGTCLGTPIGVNRGRRPCGC